MRGVLVSHGIHFYERRSPENCSLLEGGTDREHRWEKTRRGLADESHCRGCGILSTNDHGKFRGVSDVPTGALLLLLLLLLLTSFYFKKPIVRFCAYFAGHALVVSGELER